ncbi:hypothetical protein MKJ01_15050 [Chryseobacterium sp. SSA4.19]|uniref:hypothetical protein n=1 Tax=Chryseobacterium sp. SSA4.19 TaxID=2919915 RepID=UPI001F4D87A0|nr:hypothetical protein [Chryseobacterium sp. SSA4.19]MCJ8155084.1 hypothetical protein [Chryseobacterium sp. SSA4.19]
MKNIFYILIIPVILVSCKDFKKSIDDTLDSQNTVESSQNRAEADSADNTDVIIEKPVEQPIPFTSQKEKLELAEKQLRDLNQFAGKSIFIYQFIHFYDDGRIITKLQNPENSNYVDEYTYSDGQWQTPKPVVLSKMDDVQGSLINLDKLPFRNVTNVYRALSEKRKEIESHSEDYTIYAGKRRNTIQWYPQSIENERYKYDIEYHEDGTLKSFEQR